MLHELKDIGDMTPEPKLRTADPVCRKDIPSNATPHIQDPARSGETVVHGDNEEIDVRSRALSEVGPNFRAPIIHSTQLYECRDNQWTSHKIRADIYCNTIQKEGNQQ